MKTKGTPKQYVELDLDKMQKSRPMYDTQAHKLKISENNTLMMQHKMAEFVGFQTMVILVP